MEIRVLRCFLTAVTAEIFIPAEKVKKEGKRYFQP